MSSLFPSQPNQLVLYNSLSLEKEAFEPENSGKVKLYVCGPTVYDDAHLGHARCYLTWDVLVRFLRLMGYDVEYARNITDVDDKIIHRAEEANATVSDLSQTYTKRFHEDMAALHLLPPNHEPKATESMAEMVVGIQSLIEKQAAYVTPEGSVYFRTAAKADYGKLSRKPMEDLKAGARVEVNPDKESPLDFALWKRVDAAEVGWDSPWGWGRPGWHMECSAMNHALFGPQIDIHAGGVDLIFPHHENEIAQSEVWTGHVPFARYWLHNGFVNVSGEKMSKSLGNFATVRTLLNRYDANTIRYFLLTHHYRMPVDFQDEALQAAENRIQKLHRSLQQACDVLGIVAPVLAEYSWLTYSEIEQNLLLKPYLEAMLDDLNTPQAMAALEEPLTQLNVTLQSFRNGSASLKDVRQHFLAAGSLLAHSGFNLTLALTSATIPEAVQAQVQALVHEFHPSADALTLQPVEQQLQGLLMIRTEAKQSKNWAVADAIRNQLGAMGFQLMDHGTETRWEWQPPSAAVVG